MNACDLQALEQLSITAWAQECFQRPLTVNEVHGYVQSFYIMSEKEKYIVSTSVIQRSEYINSTKCPHLTVLM